jgi:hypothetical protein
VTSILFAVLPGGIKPALAILFKLPVANGLAQLTLISKDFSETIACKASISSEVALCFEWDAQANRDIVKITVAILLSVFISNKI